LTEFKVVAVSGSGSGSGKTRMACYLLSRLKGYVGIKCSPGEIYASVTDAPDIVNAPGKDTCRMIEAGAAGAVLVSSPREEMADALSQAFGLVAGTGGAVVEGNSASLAIDGPDAFIFVFGGPPYVLKQGSEECLKRAELIVVDARGEEPPEEAVEIVRMHNDDAPIRTMESVLGEGGELAEIIRRLSA